jgi:benzoate transport
MSRDVGGGGRPDMTTDPRDVIANSSMSRLQVFVVAITVALNALNGFDVLSISFASPGIAEEWGIDRAALGIVLSMELIGMAIGAIALGGVADRIGRRPTILGCLIVMAVGMFMATTVSGLGDLSAWRIVTGLGIGGMLAALNAMAAEFSNTRRRHLGVSLMSIGYPVGAVVGGIVAARLLQGNDWRAVFYFGSAVTASLIPIVFFLVPESIHWLARKQPTGALDRINMALRRMGHLAVTALPAIPSNLQTRSDAHIFAPGLAAVTTILTVAYFFHITTFYFIAKWIPKIVVDLGFAPSTAAGVLVWMNVGGATGGAVFGILTQRFNVKSLTIGLFLLSTIMVTLFGRSPADLQRLSFICALAGFCTNAGIIGLYAILAKAFPTHVRASGTGFAIGIGRGGAVLAPIIAGFLFAAGYSLPTVAFAMALGSLVAAAVLAMLRLETDRSTSSGQDRAMSPARVPVPGSAR